MIKTGGVIFGLISPILFLISCGGNSAQKAPDRHPIIDTFANMQQTDDPGKVVLNFYKWYLKSIYLKKSVEGPEVILTKDSIYEIDATKHINFLKESGYFSPKFYENEIQLYNRCGEQLKKVNVKQVEESGGLAADFVESEDCSFLSWMVWTGGQGEELSTVEIKSSNSKADIATVIAVIGDETGFKYSNPTVTLVKENGEWKISKILISSLEQKTN